MIQVEHLSKVYGKGENEVVALNDVSFSVKKENLLQSSDQAVPVNRHFCIFSAVWTVQRKESLFRRCRCVSTERRPVSNFQTQTGWTYLSVLQFNSYFECCGKYDTSGFDGRAGSESGIFDGVGCDTGTGR